jgi:hypothetical protein
MLEAVLERQLPPNLAAAIRQTLPQPPGALHHDDVSNASSTMSNRDKQVVLLNYFCAAMQILKRPFPDPTWNMEHLHAWEYDAGFVHQAFFLWPRECSNSHVVFKDLYPSDLIKRIDI